MDYFSNRRILLIDDMPQIHEDFRKILVGNSPESELDDVEAMLFGTKADTSFVGFELDSAYQGQDGMAMVQKSLDANLPYAMAFIDMRMPPGWDGVETTERLWQLDPRLQIVICTAYSDYSWEEVLTRLDTRDRLLILKKPFDLIEVRQLANTLTAKWVSGQQAALKMEHLEQIVLERNSEVLQANRLLENEINERKLLESQLIQSEKLASIGQLAAGVAHEINNPIGFIFSNFSTLETYLERLFKMLTAYENAESHITSPSLVTEIKNLRERIELQYLKEDIPYLINESKDGITRVSKIIQDLKDFSRTDTAQQWEWADLHRGIESTLNIIASEIKYSADVIKEYGAIPEVECMPSQINQVIMNLVVNAVHASVSSRGQITIRTGTGNEQVWIEIEDKGSGIPEDVLPRIFDPFFTTKPIGKGTGLGLSLSYGIIQKHNGHIDVSTAIGRGTKFRIILPIKHIDNQCLDA
ncbi:ATP-binding protein [Undibacterium sp. Ji50W]|uniref:ATP-binding protein n=1 Tax=Undibacterium sp. Ji50W TaxID=3413041 RepID=UPI003BF31C46